MADGAPPLPPMPAEAWPRDVPAPGDAIPGDPPDAAPVAEREPRPVAPLRHAEAYCDPAGGVCQPPVFAQPWRPVAVPVRARDTGETLEAMLARLHDAPPPPTTLDARRYAPRVYGAGPSIAVDAREPVPAGAWMAELRRVARGWR